jgi:hypothetical protein
MFLLKSAQTRKSVRGIACGKLRADAVFAEVAG